MIKEKLKKSELPENPDLIDDGDITGEYVTREPYLLSDYGKGCKKKKKDRVVCEKFPDAKIYTLIADVKLTRKERFIDGLLEFFADAPVGVFYLVKSLKNMDKVFYLAVRDGNQFLVTVTDEYIETRRLTKIITAGKFEIGNLKFTKCTYEVKRR